VYLNIDQSSRPRFRVLQHGNLDKRQAANFLEKIEVIFLENAIYNNA
jgi:hypothetical protein